MKRLCPLRCLASTAPGARRSLRRKPQARRSLPLTEIPALIDSEAPIAIQTRQAFELQNLFRTVAREAMADTELTAKLTETEPNLTWEQIVQKQVDKGLSGDDIYLAIIRRSQKTRQSVNEALSVKPKN
jgi:Glu-tRNA(Gln) amidotransferase subunit E-like FAD-binding protein